MGPKHPSAATVAVLVTFALAGCGGSGGTRHATLDWASDVALQPDGTLVAAGVTRVGNGLVGDDVLALARYTPSGRLDPSFGADGKVVAPRIGQAQAVDVQRDGEVLVITRRSLLRFDADGRLDRSFGRGGRIAARFAFGGDVAIEKDGRILTTGDEIVRYDERGERDRSFNQGREVHDSFFTVRIQPDGKIVAFSTRGLVARYLSDGAVDRTFHPTVVDMDGPHALALAPDGKIVVAGQMRGRDQFDFGVVRVTSNGALDPTFGNGGKVVLDFTPKPCSGCIQSTEAPLAVAVQRDGKIVAAGGTDLNGPCKAHPGTCESFVLVRFNEDGSLDRSFGRGGKVQTFFVSRVHERSIFARSSSVAHSVVIQPDGKIVAAGLGNPFDFALARYTTSGSLDPTFGDGGKVETDFGSG